jgi:hypothetical protein
MADAQPTPACTVLNPTVRAEAGLFTDGAITDALLADVAAMRGLPPRIPVPAQTDAGRAVVQACIDAAAAEHRARFAAADRRRADAILGAAACHQGKARYTDAADETAWATVRPWTVAAARALLAA